MNIHALELPVQGADGHAWILAARIPERPRAHLLWLPALGVAARHYLPFAEALAARGVAVYLHEWRGNGSSNLRPDRRQDWGYRDLLAADLPASQAAMRAHGGDGIPVIGGHSLGGQLAACYLGLHARDFERLWLVASGTPYWKTFAPPRGWLLPWFYQFAIWIARRRGTFPGRRLGFGGEEARGLIGDWAAVGLSGRYAAAGLETDLETGMAGASPAIRGVLFEHDWLAPQASLAGLLAKFPRARKHVVRLDARALGARADHFAWMKQPEAVAAALPGPDGD
ncbi:alpha/beta hydrolase family protein [Pseudoxanthomonas beigongshangi]